MSLAYRMPYRAADPDRTVESIREAAALRAVCTQARIRCIASELARIDRRIGRWSTLFADGVPVPPDVWALVAEKRRLESELRSQSGEPRATYPGAATFLEPEIDPREGPVACLVRSTAGAPLLGGFLAGIGFSCTAAFFLTCALW